MNLVEEKIPIVAIIGRPNVGKSALFNRLIGQRKAIVERTSGTTRDRLYAQISWRGKLFALVDTGGLDLLSSHRISKAVKEQASVAIAEAEIILFVCEAKDGIVGLDREIALLLRKSSKQIFLVVNKADNATLSEGAVDFYQLGLGKPYPISAMHGLGIGELLDEIAANLSGSGARSSKDAAIKVAIVGRPNVGKSSFLNCLLNEKRVIVDELPGTTRDAIDTRFRKDEVDFLLIDTAGIRHLRKIKNVVDIYGVSQARASIKRCDVCLVLIDGTEGVQRDDLGILKIVFGEGKGCVMAVNKWDLVKGSTTEKYERAVRATVPFARFVPVVFTSALTGKNVLAAVDVVKKTAEYHSTIISTGELNREIGAIWKAHPPPLRYGTKEIKLRYATQVSTKPPNFLIFVNDSKAIKKSYVRYLEGRLRESFGLVGTSLRIRFTQKKK